MIDDHQLLADDLPVGLRIDLGSYRVTREEIIEFATAWDPMPFHVDDEAAAGTIFGDIVGSGLQTMAIFQRLSVLGAYRHWAVIAGRTIREVSFSRPLRPDTTVRAEITVEAVTPTTSGRSLVTLAGRIAQDETVLMDMTVDVYVARKPA